MGLRHSRRWLAAAPRPASKLGCFLPLLGCENRVEVAPGSLDDGIQLRLYLSSDHTKLPALSIHDRIHPPLLVRCQTNLPRKAISELPSPGRRTPHRVFHPGPVEHSREQHQPIHRNSGQTSHQEGKQQDQHCLKGSP
jgi:hypothetical protein